MSRYPGRISVVMTTFNGEKYLREQVDSILSQLSENDELLISDDGSLDGTMAILSEYGSRDRRIRILKGQYSLKAGGIKCVGIGSLDGDFRFEISNCMLSIEVNAEQGVCIGSIGSTSGLYLTKTSLNLTGSGDILAAHATKSVNR